MTVAAGLSRPNPAKTMKVTNFYSPSLAEEVFTIGVIGTIKRYVVRARGRASLYLYDPETMGSFITINKGCSFEQDNVLIENLQLFMKCNRSLEIIELITWT